MNIGVISVRYTRALLRYALEQKSEDKVYAEMQTLAGSFIEVPELKLALANPVLSQEQKVEIVVKAAGGSVCDVSLRFFQFLFKEKRGNVLQFIANSYVEQYRKNKNITQGKLITASKVTPQMEEQMKKLVERHTNGNVEFITVTDPTIKGGFILEYDTYRIDASVASQLRRVLSQFNKLNIKTA